MIAATTGRMLISVCGRDGLDVLGGHALADHPLHAGQPDADLVLDQLADAADAAVGEVVLIVEAVAGFGLDQVEQVRHRGEDLAAREDRLVGLGQVEVEHRELLGDLAQFRPELAVQLVATDPRQVVATVLEERGAEVVAGRVDRRRLTGAGSLVDLDQGVFLGGRDVAVLLPLVLEEVELAHEGLEEAGRVLLVVAEGTQEHEDRQATLAGDAAPGGDRLARLLLDVELDPLAPVGVDGAGDQLVLGQVAETEALTGLEDDAGRTDELADDDTLGAVDDEGAAVGHHREVPHEDRLLLDLARAGVHEPGAHEDRRGVGHVLFLALLDGELGVGLQVLVEGVELQLELELLAVVLDRAHVPEGVGEAFLQEPLERLTLDGDEVRDRQDFVEIRERVTVAGGSGRQGASSEGDENELCGFRSCGLCAARRKPGGGCIR